MTNVLQTVGNTPLVLLQQIPINGRVFVKLESVNPTGSIKDRVAVEYVKELKSKNMGKVTVVLASSGNIGVSFAMACAFEQIPLIVVMPQNLSVEGRLLI